MRFVRTLTSRGCGSLKSMALLNLLESVDQLIKLFRSHVMVKVIVDLHGRRPGAGTHAFDFLERELPVGSDFLMPDSQLLASMLIQLHATHQQTGDVRTNLHV